MKNKKSTSDVYLASLFLAEGASIVDANKDDPRHMEFFFETTEDEEFLDLDDLERQWVNRTAFVNAFNFSEGIKRMKSFVHSSK